MAQAPAPGGRVVVLARDHLIIADIVDIAEGRANVEMSADGMARVRSARAVIEHYIDQGLPAYGIATMYGADFQTALPPAAMRRFGRINIIQESTRVGDGTWALLVNSFARGFSGASPDLVATLVDRVSAHAVPENLEYGNSMGVADLTANAQAATSLLQTPGFDLKPGEATNLLTHNFWRLPGLTR